MFQTKKKIIVASGSPRRQQFFKNLGMEFQVLNIQKNELHEEQEYSIPEQGVLGVHDREERPCGNEKPEEYVKRMVQSKTYGALSYLGFLRDGRSVSAVFEKNCAEQPLSFSFEKFSLSHCIKESKDISVITADTVVCMAGEILGKPKSEQEAFAMLKKLKGKTHAVITAVAFTDMADKACYVFSDKTEVTFAPWADAVLEAYAKTGEGFDKAGAYGISGTGSFLSSSVHGCLDTVIGLPVAKCVEFLLWNGAITI